MRVTISFALFFLFCITTGAQGINIIPQPASVKQPVAGTFSISPATVIILEGSNLERTAAFLNDYLQQFYLFKLKIVRTCNSSNAIRLNYDRLDNPLEGAYNMTVDNKGAYIGGDNERGVFYGVQTLIQLLPVPDARLKMRPAKLDIPFVAIEDAPRFEYRGMHLDVSRHFFPVAFVKKYIDYLAYHKFNTFHWHLTDDQGWRIEIKKYPKLTTVGAYRNGTIIGRYPGTGSDNTRYGGSYSQAEIRDVVNYAKTRYVDVIPEIEMPGHGSAAIAAYPWLSCFPGRPTAIPEKMISRKSVEEQAAGRIKLVQETWGVFDDVFCAGKDSTFQFFQDVIDEVIKLFPSKYVHVGGDECPKTHWKQCPSCQQRMKQLGLKDEHELQSYFIQRMEKYINSKGKTLIGWDEILEGGLAPKAVVMSWRGEAGGIEAAKLKHQVIMTPGNPVYFDYTQSANEDSVTIGGYNPLEKVYAYEPIPKELDSLQGTYVLGPQANMWSEYMHYPSKVEYMAFPRMAALSEVGWSSKANRDWSSFEKRLPTQLKRYDLWGAHYSRAYYDLKATVVPADNNAGLLWKVETNAKDGRIVYPANESGSLLSDYVSPISISTSDTLNAFYVVNGKTVGGVSQEFSFNKATGKKITLKEDASKNYPGDGAFTLVNGVQNKRGLGRSREFLGFNGKDCEAVIDFGTGTEMSEVVIHTLEQAGSWIYFPGRFDISGSADGVNFAPFNAEVAVSKTADNTRATIKLSRAVTTRFLKVMISNYGVIPQGQAGAGNRAWLFVDEIEVF